jgi:protein tyrosine/serine phosphatase
MAPSFRSLAAKYSRREQRISRWRKPLTTRRARLRAWLSMLIADHGLLRLAFRNRHRIGDKLWRSAQPLPRDIAWAAGNGIRTIVNLRGGREYGCWPLEKEACEAFGIRLIDMPLYARGAPSRESIRWAARLFSDIEYPALIHCKSGADRTGLAAALFLLLHEKRPAADARAQLHLRYGHMRWTRTGVLDAFFDTFARDGEARGLAFLDWVESRYDPAALKESFVPRLGRRRRLLAANGDGSGR